MKPVQSCPIERTLVSRLIRSRLSATCLLATLCLLVIPGRSPAIDALTLSIGDVQGEGWNASDVTIAFELASDGNTLVRLRAKRMTLLPELGAVTDVTVECPNPVVKGPQYGCKDAKVKGLFGRVGRQQFTANATYDSTRGTLDFSTRGMRIAAVVRASTANGSIRDGGSNSRPMLRGLRSCARSSCRGWICRRILRSTDAPR